MTVPTPKIDAISTTQQIDTMTKHQHPSINIGVDGCSAAAEEIPAKPQRQGCTFQTSLRLGRWDSIVPLVLSLHEAFHAWMF